jgi:hypothetical protein
MGRRFAALHRSTSSAGTRLRHSAPPDHVVENTTSERGLSCVSGFLLWPHTDWAHEELFEGISPNSGLRAGREGASLDAKTGFLEFPGSIASSGVHCDCSTSNNARSSRSDCRETTITELLITRETSFCTLLLVILRAVKIGRLSERQSRRHSVFNLAALG